MGEDPILWAFEHFYHLDQSNSKIHCAPVKFSPITFRLGLLLEAVAEDGDEDITQEVAIVREHRGAYALDTGR